MGFSHTDHRKRSPSFSVGVSGPLGQYRRIGFGSLRTKKISKQIAIVGTYVIKLE